jgi:hypothetical protein
MRIHVLGPYVMYFMVNAFSYSVSSLPLFFQSISNSTIASDRGFEIERSSQYPPKSSLNLILFHSCQHLMLQTRLLVQIRSSILILITSNVLL